MAVIDNFRTVGAARQGVFARIWAETFGALIAWNDARATRKSLGALTDRELDDIGLVRGDIDWIAERR